MRCVTGDCGFVGVVRHVFDGGVRVATCRSGLVAAGFRPRRASMDGQCVHRAGWRLCRLPGAARMRSPSPLMAVEAVSFGVASKAQPNVFRASCVVTKSSPRPEREHAAGTGCDHNEGGVDQGWAHVVGRWPGRRTAEGEGGVGLRFDWRRRQGQAPERCECEGPRGCEHASVCVSCARTLVFAVVSCLPDVGAWGPSLVMVMTCPVALWVGSCTSGGCGIVVPVSGVCFSCAVCVHLAMWRPGGLAIWRASGLASERLGDVAVVRLEDVGLSGSRPGASSAYWPGSGLSGGRSSSSGRQSRPPTSPGVSAVGPAGGQSAPPPRRAVGAPLGRPNSAKSPGRGRRGVPPAAPPRCRRQPPPTAVSPTDPLATRPTPCQSRENVGRNHLDFTLFWSAGAVTQHGGNLRQCAAGRWRPSRPCWAGHLVWEARSWRFRVGAAKHQARGSASHPQAALAGRGSVGGHRCRVQGAATGPRCGCTAHIAQCWPTLPEIGPTHVRSRSNPGQLRPVLLAVISVFTCWASSAICLAL